MVEGYSLGLGMYFVKKIWASFERLYPPAQQKK